MRIAIWDHPVADLLYTGIKKLRSFDVQVVRTDIASCSEMLRTGEADIVLLSPLEVLMDTGSFDVLPGSAISTWSYPFAKLLLPGELGDPVPTLHVDPRYGLENLAALIVLGELYDQEPAVAECGVCDEADIVAAGEAMLLCGPEALKGKSKTVLDLGQEWYEFANYPLVLGLLATLKGNGDSEAIEFAVALADEMDEAREEVMKASGAELEAFYREDLRTRFDDMATASLTEFSEMLLYYGVLEEVPDLPVVYLEEGEEEEDEDDNGDDGRLPLL